MQKVIILHIKVFCSKCPINLFVSWECTSIELSSILGLEAEFYSFPIVSIRSVGAGFPCSSSVPALNEIRISSCYEILSLKLFKVY